MTVRLALLKSGEISQATFDEFDGRHYGVETKLINLAKSLARKMSIMGLIQGWRERRCLLN